MGNYNIYLSAFFQRRGPRRSQNVPLNNRQLSFLYGQIHPNYVTHPYPEPIVIHTGFRKFAYPCEMKLPGSMEDPISGIVQSSFWIHVSHTNGGLRRFTRK